MWRAFVLWWTSTRRVTAQFNHLDRKIRRLHTQRELAEKALDAQEARLLRIKRLFDAELERTQTALDTANNTIKKLDEALTAAQTEVDTAKQLTIPGLVASHNVLLGQLEAQISMYAARTALANHPLRDGGVE
jgi:predicted  nucleic acid-binding Zn-ribbon protein